MKLKYKLGKRIQELRLSHNLKQSELAEKVGIATKTQSCIETGKNYPSAELIERYACVFGVDVADVLNISHIKNNEEIMQNIHELLKTVDSNDLFLIYKIIKSVLK